MFQIFLYTHFLCTSLVKPYCAENNNNLLFKCHTFMFCNLPDFIEVEHSTYQHVQYFIRRKNGDLNFTHN